jgi:DNA repair exonuclease SbcCD ATPase subunit
VTYQEACNDLMQLEQEVQVLQQRKYREEQVIEIKKKELEKYTDDLYREHYDVKQLEKNSIGTLLKKISGNYQKEYEKETKEYLAAKAKYDEFNIMIEDLQSEVNRYRNEIVRKEQEIKRKKQDLRSNYPEGMEVAKKEEELRKKLYSQKKELEEAITATQRVYELAMDARDQYKSAKSWATYDTFFNGGLISDLIKYDKIDNAAALISQLQSATDRMNKELRDVKIAFDSNINQIDGGTRFFDIAFDNIFTDWSVRNKLSSNVDELTRYCSKVESLLASLRNEKRGIEQRLLQL